MMITVFTPTYNRAHLLHDVYDSLVEQTFTDFEWVVVDDGSKDDTPAVIQGFIDEGKINIRFFSQQNGGKHRAINHGVKEAKGEMFFILDSDDVLPNNSLAIVAEEYNKVKGDESFGGVCGLDAFKNGNIIGSGLSHDCIDCSSLDIRYKYGVTGDMKEVFRTDVLREFPFPEIEGERFCPEDH
jgi:glycosyltransferase involved in cell wall biosynthesis